MRQDQETRSAAIGHAIALAGQWNHLVNEADVANLFRFADKVAAYIDGGDLGIGHPEPDRGRVMP